VRVIEFEIAESAEESSAGGANYCGLLLRMIETTGLGVDDEGFASGASRFLAEIGGK
jgi:hypothetical protein